MEKQDLKTTTPEPSKKVERYLPPWSEHLWKLNRELLPDDLVKKLIKVPIKAIPIEDEVTVSGLKNPLCLFILGLSCSNVYKYCVSLKKDIRHIIIIEPDLGRFKSAMGRYYFVDMIKDPRVDLLIGQDREELGVSIYRGFLQCSPKFGPRASTCGNPEIVTDPFIYGKAPLEDSKDLVSNIIGTSQQLFLSMGCSPDSYSRWLQTARNFDTMKTCNKMGKLHDQFKKIPAIVIGGGPSMESFIKVCKEKKLDEKCLLIACDASLKRLLKEGIRPHIVTRCERKLTDIFSGVEKKDLDGIYYAAYPWCPPEFFDLFPESFMLFRNNGICKWTRFDHAECNGGVSSANAALELCFNLGCTEIVVTGIDLCFIDNKSHVAGTEVEFDIESSKSKWTQILGNSKEMVTTIPVWTRCLGEYVNSISKYKSIRPITIYNTSSKGVYIHGTTLKGWNEITASFEKYLTVDIVSMIKSKLEKPSEETIATHEQTKKDTLIKLEAALKELGKIFLFIDDSMTNGAREEEKIVLQLKMHRDLKPLYDNLEKLKVTLYQMYEKSCKQVDRFKKEFYQDFIFVNTIMDTCQLDLYKSENDGNALKNRITIEHERLKEYIRMHEQLYRIYEYYIVKMIDLFKGESKDEADSGMLSES